MKKKYIVIALLSTGIILLCISIILAIIATGNKNIIGGADLPTFLFVFTCEKTVYILHSQIGAFLASSYPRLWLW